MCGGKKFQLSTIARKVQFQKTNCSFYKRKFCTLHAIDELKILRFSTGKGITSNMNILLCWLFLDLAMGVHSAPTTSIIQRLQDEQEFDQQALEMDANTRAQVTPLRKSIAIEEQARPSKRKASVAEKESCPIPLETDSNILEIVSTIHKYVLSELIDNCGFQKKPGSAFRVIATMAQKCINHVDDPELVQKMIKQLNFYADVINTAADVGERLGNFKRPTCVPKTASYSPARARRVIERNALKAFLQNHMNPTNRMH